MNIMIWIFGGGIAGWIGYSYVKFNQDRGMTISCHRTVGGFFGGKVVAPMLGSHQPRQ